MDWDPARRLLLAARARFSDDALELDTELVDYLRRHLNVDAAGGQRPDCDDLRREIRRAIDRYVDADLREPLLLMVGMHQRTSGSRMTREQILSRVAESLPRQRGRDAGVILGNARVAQIERSELIPALRTAIESRAEPEAIDDPANVQVRLRLSPGSRDSEVLLRTTMDFEVERKEIEILLTDHEAFASELCASHPSVFEVIVPAHGTDPADVDVRLIALDRGSRPVEVTQTFQSADEIGEVFAPPPGASFGRAVFRTTPIPGSPTPRYRLQIETPITYDTGYVFWNCPRRMQVASIEVDARDFPRSESHSFTLQPMLSGAESIDNFTPLQWYVEVDRIVSAGNGLVLMWRTDA